MGSALVVTGGYGLVGSCRAGSVGRGLSWYRLSPTPAQERALLVRCSHARFVRSLAVEQCSWWMPWRGPAPDLTVQRRQFTEERAVFDMAENRAA